MRKIIYLAGFLFSISIALMAYINSSFISSFIGEKLVGTIYILGSIFSVLTLSLAPHLFRKIGGHKFLLLIIGLDVLSILPFAFSQSSWMIVPAFILGFALNSLVVFSMDELLEILSKDSVTGKIRGTYLAICSTAWVIAQLSLGTALGSFSLKTIYLVALLVMILFFLLSFLGLKNIPNPKYAKIQSYKYIKQFFKEKKLFCAYGISFLLQFFYCWMIIYTPIYLSAHLGFSWKEIGLIFAIMLLPFSFIPYFLGKHADKVGERKMLMLGFLIASLFTFVLFFLHKNGIWVWAFALFLNRVGAATIEAMGDAYFFKHIKPENEEFVGVYRSASPVAYILGPLAAIAVFALVPSFNFIYLILGTIMLFGIYLSSTIKKSDI